MIEMFVDFLPCDVFRNADRSFGDCTNNGVSARFTELYLCKDYVTEDDVIEYCEAKNCLSEVERFVKTETRIICGKEYKNIKLVFEGRQKIRGLLGGMAGGNILYTSDSRWEKITGCSYPLTIHDRYETQEEYDMLSR